MPKRTSKKAGSVRPTDINQLAHLLVRESTEEKQDESEPTTRKPIPKSVSRVMAQMGSKGGKIGGKARLTTMTPEDRSRIASEAARVRWAKAKNAEG
jgi:hypothetical protein